MISDLAIRVGTCISESQQLAFQSHTGGERITTSRLVAFTSRQGRSESSRRAGGGYYDMEMAGPLGQAPVEHLQKCIASQRTRWQRPGSDAWKRSLPGLTDPDGPMPQNPTEKTIQSPLGVGTRSRQPVLSPANAA